MLAKIEGRRRRGQQRMRRLESITDSMDMDLSRLQETVKDRGSLLQSMELQRAGHNLVTQQQQTVAQKLPETLIQASRRGCVQRSSGH